MQKASQQVVNFNSPNSTYNFNYMCMNHFLYYCPIASPMLIFLLKYYMYRKMFYTILLMYSSSLWLWRMIPPLYGCHGLTIVTVLLLMMQRAIIATLQLSMAITACSESEHLASKIAGDIYDVFPKALLFLWGVGPASS